MARPATMEDAKQVALRLPGYWLARIDKLAAIMSTPAGKMCRTTMIRMALHRGLESFEADHNLNPFDAEWRER